MYKYNAIREFKNILNIIHVGILLICNNFTIISVNEE